jgi:hypothetical protein
MAKVMSPLYSAKASGKFMAMVFQTWRGLAVVREFEAPTQPRTPRQMTVRAIFTAISQYWANTLTEGLRIAWSNFVLRWTDLWGNEVSLTGLNLFQKFNFILRDSGRAFQTTTPPTIFPSEIEYTSGGFETGQPNPNILPIETSEGTTKDIFNDIWFAGKPESVIVEEDVNSVDVTIRTTGLPQGVNPVKSDFSHCVYVSQNVAQEANPALTKNISISILPPVGGVFTSPTRIALIIRRYNKHGNYSAPVKISDIARPV